MAATRSGGLAVSKAKPLAEATEWLEGYRRSGEGSFQRLDALLDELKTKEKKRGRAKR